MMRFRDDSFAQWWEIADVLIEGGSVDVDDTPGGGATFRVALPLMPADALTPAEPSVATA